MHHKSIASLVFLLLAFASLERVEAYEVEKKEPEKAKWLFPEKFGNFSLGSCSGAPSCGTNLASYNGIWAKSNGVDQVILNSCRILTSILLSFFFLPEIC
jgi:hypothetical protein